jgi:hypothetical protein
MKTPTNLRELTLNIMATPLADIQNQTPFIIRDYMSQKFQRAMIVEHDNADVVIALEKLFKELTKGVE